MQAGSGEIPRLTGHITGKTVFLVEDNPALRAEMAGHLSHFGFQVSQYPSVDIIRGEIEHQKPDALIVDMVFPEGSTAMIIAEIQQSLAKPVPVIFLSEKQDSRSRLQAVRFGGSAYFAKPVDINALINVLDSLTVDASPEPYRILIVENDKSLADTYSAILREAGMHTEITGDPLNILNLLPDFDPELILMDLFFPDCLGIEVASVVRQHESMVSIPIVFHSEEASHDNRAAAMFQGGDDFLIRPIAPNLLISSVLARVQRSRTLRSLMIRDSLTGLLNHTALRLRLGMEVAKARRNRKNLCFAMVDIDKFKRVNDTYGHATGDQVIKNLGRTLLYRLRSQDYVGRYGGEEFAVIMPDTSPAEAVALMNEARIAYSEIRHASSLEEFTSTFSCGVASFPEFEVATRLNDIADKALYHAKKNGANRVLLGAKKKK